jgi:nickel-dependent lactate racemase
MAELELKYGSRTYACRLDGARVLTATVPPCPADPAALVRDALRAPIGSPTLDEIVRPGEKVVVVTSDITRYTGSEVYLPVLIEQLNACGIPDNDIEILVGLGIHRKQTENEHRKILGPLFGRIRVVDHDCDNPAELVTIGGTADGMTVAVNRRVMEADRVIVTGTVGFHYFAGFGGGRKGLVPGVAARETCMASHFRVLNPPGIGGRHPRAATGMLEGNPVHAAILAAARMVEPDFLLNTVLSPQKEMLAVFAGDMEQAHLAACDLVRKLYAVGLSEPADLAVVSCGGQPKDINFIQAHKALDYGVGALREGGTIILLAACPDGFGNATFFDWFRHRDPNAFEAALRERYEINGQTAYSTLMKAKRYRVILVSELGEAEARQMGMEKAVDLDTALRMAYEKLPPNPHTVVVPDGGTVLPIVKAEKT